MLYAKRGSQFNFKGFNMPEFSNVSSIIIIENPLRYNPRIVEDMNDSWTSYDTLCGETGKIGLSKFQVRVLQFYSSLSMENLTYHRIFVRTTDGSSFVIALKMNETKPIFTTDDGKGTNNNK